MRQTRNAKGFPVEPFFSGAIKRGIQILAFLAPGESSMRVWLHRLRGVRIGTQCRIGMGTLIETSFPEWVSIGNHVTLGMRSEEHTSELQSQSNLVCRLLLEK